MILNGTLRLHGWSHWSQTADRIVERFTDSAWAQLPAGAELDCGPEPALFVRQDPFGNFVVDCSAELALYDPALRADLLFGLALPSDDEWAITKIEYHPHPAQ
jgi:hypothetical protein